MGYGVDPKPIKETTIMSEQHPGRKVVTVARDGAKTAKRGKFSFPVYTTAVYISCRRQRDGKLTWRLSERIASHSTSGHLSGAMVARAKGYARYHGLEFLPNIRHGQSAECTPT